MTGKPQDFEVLPNNCDNVRDECACTSESLVLASVDKYNKYQADCNLVIALDLPA